MVYHLYPHQSLRVCDVRLIIGIGYLNLDLIADWQLILVLLGVVFWFDNEGSASSESTSI